MSAKKSSAAVAATAGHVDSAGLGAPRSPQVNLLPTEIRARRALGRVKAVFVERSAASDLAAKQAEVQRLVNEQAQYGEVPVLKAQIASTESARRLGMSTEVLWKGYLGAIQAVTPADVTITQLATELPSPTI